jgi:hypothetical protein
MRSPTLLPHASTVNPSKAVETPRAMPAASMSATSSPAIKCNHTTDDPKAPTTNNG